MTVPNLTERGADDRREDLPALRVLIVDDDSRDIYLVERALKKSSYHIVHGTVAYSAQEARAHLAKVRFDLCLVDFWLTSDTSIQLVNHIVQDHGTPVILMSGLELEDIKMFGSRAGAFRFLPKQQINAESLDTIIQDSLVPNAKASPKDTFVTAPPEDPSLDALASWMAGLLMRLDRLEQSLLAQHSSDSDRAARPETVKPGYARIRSETALARSEIMMRLALMGEPAARKLPELTGFDIALLMEEVLAGFADDFGVREININFERPDGPILVEHDVSLMRDMLVSLFVYQFNEIANGAQFGLTLDASEHDFAIVLTDDQRALAVEEVDAVLGDILPARTIGEVLSTPRGSRLHLATSLAKRLNGTLDLDGVQDGGLAILFTFPRKFASSGQIL